MKTPMTRRSGRSDDQQSAIMRQQGRLLSIFRLALPNLARPSIACSSSPCTSQIRLSCTLLRKGGVEKVYLFLIGDPDIMIDIESHTVHSQLAAYPAPVLSRLHRNQGGSCLKVADISG